MTGNSSQAKWLMSIPIPILISQQRKRKTVTVGSSKNGTFVEAGFFERELIRVLKVSAGSLCNKPLAKY
jgi:hypothetical protein